MFRCIINVHINTMMKELYNILILEIHAYMKVKKELRMALLLLDKRLKVVVRKYR